MEGTRQIYSLQGAPTSGLQKLGQVVTRVVVKNALTRIENVDLVNALELFTKML